MGLWRNGKLTERAGDVNDPTRRAQLATARPVEGEQLIGALQDGLTPLPIVYRDRSPGFGRALGGNVDLDGDGVVDGGDTYAGVAPGSVTSHKSLETALGGALTIAHLEAQFDRHAFPGLERPFEIHQHHVIAAGLQLDAARLDFLSRLFVQVVIGARSGDYRNWEAIRAWAASLRPALIGE